MSSPLNLGLVGAAFATIGGMVYGGYELLKNEPREIKDLIKIKKRVRLDKNSKEDEPLGLQNGTEYIKAHTRLETKEVELEKQPASPDAPKTKTVKEEVVEKNDVGGFLSEGGTDKVKADTLPAGFKDKCDKEFEEQQPGIGTEGYKNFEKYCTKPDPEEE